VRRSERLLKALAVACLSTGVALAMHVAGGGALPTPSGIAVPFILALAAGAQLAGATPSRWRLAAAVTVSQAAFHVLFSWGAGATMSVAPGLGAHAGHDPRALALTVGGGHTMQSHLTPAMVAAHALAALGTYAVLRHAEALLEAGRRWARDLVSRLEPPSTRALVPAGRTLAARPALARRLRIVAHAQGVRGPPLSLA